ncbi:MAG: hypothetical protein ACTHPS_11870 [Streptosporangiaceae bacterium]
MAESDGDYEDDVIVVDLGHAVTEVDEDGNLKTTITDERLFHAVNEARHDAGEEYIANVDSAPREIRVRVHSW